MRGHDVAVLDHERVALAPGAAEDGGPVEVELQGLGEGRGRVAEEADLQN